MSNLCIKAVYIRTCISVCVSACFVYKCECTADKDEFCSAPFYSNERLVGTLTAARLNNLHIATAKQTSNFSRVTMAPFIRIFIPFLCIQPSSSLLPSSLSSLHPYHLPTLVFFTSIFYFISSSFSSIFHFLSVSSKDEQHII